VYEDTGEELARIQRQFSGLTDRLATAGAGLPPHADGADLTGAVQVRVGPDGIPVAVRVAPDWPRRLRPEAFAGAVVAACRAAEQARSAAWNEALARDGWPDGAARPPAGEAVEGAADEVTPRPFGDLVEDILKAADDAEAFIQHVATTARGAGRNAGRQPVVELSSAGLVSCQADPRWVSRQTGPGLAAAVQEAVAAARTGIGQVRQAPDPAPRLDRLRDELFTIFTDPRHLAGS
jgi:hypothetical protein